jgi:hypothetical protein
MSIGAVYANGAQDISDSVLGVQIIDDLRDFHANCLLH